MKTTTILLVDDHALVRQTWAFFLDSHPHYHVIGEAQSGEEGVTLAKLLRPDIVIMDISMSGINGIEATSLIHECSPTSKVLGASFYIQPSYARMMLKKGAMGYVTKSSSREEMLEALSMLQQGKKYVCREIKEILTEQMLFDEPGNKGYHALSHREIEVIDYVKKGCSSKTIANALNISVKTVEVHRYNILKKLNLKNTAALVNFMNVNEITFD